MKINNIKLYIFSIIIIIILIQLIIKLNKYNINNINNLELEYFDNNNETIPKIIIQTWKNNIIPLKYKNEIYTMRKYNSDFKLMFFNDEQIENFLKTNYNDTYYQSYKRLPVFIQKIDYFRYIAIYHYGGFYFDLDMLGYYPLDDLLKYECVFPVDENISNNRCKKIRFNKFCNNNLRFLLGQYAFGARKNNQFIKLLIDTIHENIDNYITLYEKIKDTTNNDLKYQYVYSTTGPDFVTFVYYNYPLKDKIHILHYNYSQHFGKYALHNHYGTWK